MKATWRRVGAWVALVLVAIVGFHAHQQDIDKNRALLRDQRADEMRVAAVVQQLAVSERHLVAVEVGACQSRNALRAGIIGFVTDAVPRSKRTLDATVADPTATVAQKQTAFKNYASLLVTARQLARRLPFDDCHAGLPLQRKEP